jgi:hypothetical protein
MFKMSMMYNANDLNFIQYPGIEPWSSSPQPIAYLNYPGLSVIKNTATIKLTKYLCHL